MREHLVGYLLGVLDDAEHVQVCERLEEDPRLRQDLERIRSRLEPLESTKAEFDPPPGLVERTCMGVAELVDRGKPSSRRSVMALGSEPSTVRFTAADAVVAIGVVLAASIFFFPAIANSRYQARVVACQNNLRELHVDLREYSLIEGGHFPFVPAEGNRAAAGIYAPKLLEKGLLDDVRVVLCPASPRAERAEAIQIPTLTQVDQARGAELAQLRRDMGGDYGYCLGYQLEDGRLVAVRDLGRNHFVIVADMPQLIPAGGNSRNHGGRGQNVLYEGGGVKYLLSCLEEFSGDDFFLSARGQVEAGLHSNDSVVAHSAAPPILTPIKAVLGSPR